MSAVVTRQAVAGREDGMTRLWLPMPLSILWVLLAPFALIASLFAVFLPRPYRVNGPAAAVAMGVVLFSLSGTLVEVKNRKADIFILIL